MNITELRKRLDSLSPDEAGIVYLGGAGFLISYRGTNVLVDPYLSYSVDKAIPNARWSRLYPPPFEPRELSFADWVFISHDHLDHADPETVAPLSAANDSIVVVCGEAIAENVNSYGAARVEALSCGEKRTFGAISATAIPAAHEEVHLDKNGEPAECGYIFGLGGMRIYHSGDSLVYDGLAQRVNGADVMLLPVNGNGFFRRAEDIVGNMDAYDAANLAMHCGARLLVPMHYDLYPGNFVPGAAVDAIIRAAAPELRFALPAVGEGWRISESEIAAL